jgi:hypothetical protein
MPKPRTYPILYDDLKKLSVSFLKRNRYLIPNQLNMGRATWSRNGNVTGEISIRVYAGLTNSILELDYKCNQIPINYGIKMVSTPSNLGKGLIWYFICPFTGKRCKSLYLTNTYFCHRSAFGGGMYERQTHSKKYRQLEKMFGGYYRTEQLFEQINRKHFKKWYAGKPTKKYLKLTEQIQKAKVSF